MKLSDYQDSAVATAIYPQSGTGSFNALSYATLGLVNEAGEVAGKLKKVWRDEEGKIGKTAEDALVGELGDVLWYLSAAASELGYSLDEVAERNIAKLNSRKERGVIGGSADNR